MRKSKHLESRGTQVVRIITQLSDYVEFYKQCGFEGLPRTAPEDPHALERLRNELAGCQRCKLSHGRTHIVFGEGNPQATLMFIGEGPGVEEDQQGRPFIGKSGELLTRMIQAIGLRREDVYITSIVKCRPPQNRDPEPEEIAMCVPFLRRQIEFIQPRLLCALGRVAAQTLLETTTPISQLRGHFHEYDGIKLMPTFHPAYLLRNPHDKRLAWEDLQSVQREYGMVDKSLAVKENT